MFMDLWYTLCLFSASSASCHGQCHHLEDFFPKKTQSRGTVVVRTVLKMLTLCLVFPTSLFFYLLFKIFFIIRMFISIQMTAGYSVQYLNYCNCKVVISEVMLSHFKILLAVQRQQYKAQYGLSA